MTIRRTATPHVLLPLVALASGCTQPVDVAGLPAYELSDYTSWENISVAGSAPGHGTTYRIIYINDVARSYGHAGEYRVGSILVKEIYSLEGEDQRGALSYVAAMRKMDPDEAEQHDLPLDGGWLFSFFDGPGDPESRAASCWEGCHVQGPVDGAWLDYGR